MNRIRTSALVAALALLPMAAPAAATPNSGVEARTLAESTVDGVHYVTRELTVAPGGTTGWHWHPGQVYGVIRQGTLTHYSSANCAVDGVYGVGDTITEETGLGYIHVGRNLGPDPLVLWVGYIVPAGQPLANDAPNPGCPFE